MSNPYLMRKDAQGYYEGHGALYERIKLSSEPTKNEGTILRILGETFFEYPPGFDINLLPELDMDTVAPFLEEVMKYKSTASLAGKIFKGIPEYLARWRQKR